MATFIKKDGTSLEPLEPQPAPDHPSQVQVDEGGALLGFIENYETSYDCLVRARRVKLSIIVREDDIERAGGLRPFLVTGTIVKIMPLLNFY